MINENKVLSESYHLSNFCNILYKSLSYSASSIFTKGKILTKKSFKS